MSFEEGVNTLEDGRIQVRFSMMYKDIPYQDALVLSQSDYAALSPFELDAMKLDRFNNWVINYEAANSATPEEPLPEDAPE